VEFFGVRSLFHIGSLAKFRYKLMFDPNQDSNTLDNSNSYLDPQDPWSEGLNTDSSNPDGGNLGNNELYGLAKK
jgi:hypothetical protein